MTLRMPAEWERHAAVWLPWPKNAADWPGKFAPIPWAMAEIVRLIVNTEGDERVRLCVDASDQAKTVAARLRKAGVDLSRVDIWVVPTDRGWMRDCGPVIVRDESSGKLVSLDFGFTAWAKYPNFAEDDRVRERAARLLGVASRTPESHGRRVVLECGAIDVNGRGDLLTTEECLLDPAVQVRNPGFAKADYEALFKEWLGAENVIWLNKGIAGDDTHGHVDDLCRFVSADTVVLCRETDPADENYAALEENRERLQSVRLSGGGKLQVIDLPMPAPVIFDGMRLPASYANFLITNTRVLVPTFNDPKDRTALGVLAELFPDREVVGVHAVDLVWGLGTVHCLSREEPAPL